MAVQALLSSTNNASLMAEFLATGNITSASSASSQSTGASASTSSIVKLITASSTSSSTTSSSSTSKASNNSVSLLYDKRDANQDGVVTVLEQILYDLKHPALLGSTGSTQARIYDKRDADQDGTVSYAERLMYDLRHSEVSSSNQAGPSNSQWLSGLRAYQQNQATGYATRLTSSFFQV